MTRTRTIASIVVLLIGLAAALQAQQSVTGKVDSVILYRGQALVRRTVPVAGKAGPMELVVAELPTQVLPDSLFAEGAGDVEVRAVRFRTRAVGEDPREDIRRLRDQIEDINRKIARNQRMKQLVQEQLQYLGKLEQFVAPTATVEMSKGVLDAKQLRELTEFAFTKREELAQRQLTLDEEATQLREELTLAQRKLGELASGSTKTVREALVFLEKKNPGNGTLTLSYLVGGAGWSPTYNVRGNRKDGKAAIEYSAIIRQTSGEDWTGIELTLSTASPALSAEGPALAPFKVALGGQIGGQQANMPPSPAQNKADFGQIQRELKQAQMGQQKAKDLAGNLDQNWKMNVAANRYQALELSNDEDVLRDMQMQASMNFDEPSVSYRLAGTVSLESRNDQQMIRIAALSLPAEFYHIATPVLAGYVYREASIENTSEDVLLRGPVNVYLDGRFVGRGELPTVANGQTFVMGFGADSQLRTERELVERTESTQGGNQVVQFSYRLTIENYKNEAVKVRLKDRIPVSDNDAAIKVTLGETSDALSDDALYKRLERPKGILRWDIEVKPQAAGEDARIVTYDYKIEYDRQRALTIPGEANGDGRLREEFNKLQKSRMLH